MKVMEKTWNDKELPSLFDPGFFISDTIDGERPATLRFPTIYGYILTNINPLKFVVNRLIIRTFVPRNFLYHMSELIALPG